MSGADMRTETRARKRTRAHTHVDTHRSRVAKTLDLSVLNDSLEAVTSYSGSTVIHSGFHRGGMLAGGPVAWMPEHVSGESSPSAKLS